MKKSILRFFSAFIFAVLVGNAFAQKTDNERIEDLKARYPVIKTIPFKDSNPPNQTLTAFYKNKDRSDSPAIFSMSVQSEKDGARIVFKAYKPCLLLQSVYPLEERVILVNNQKVQTYYMCSPFDNESNQEIYLVKNKEGTQYAREEFTTKAYVFVSFSNMDVPFNTEGFTSAFSRANGKAL